MTDLIGLNLPALTDDSVRPPIGSNTRRPSAPDARTSGQTRAEHDWYTEPAAAVDALLDAERFSGLIWDPACGGGNIPTRCRARGLPAIGTDLVDRGFGRVMDFLRPDAADDLPPVDAIISNPPFVHAEDFIRLALERAERKVAMLLRLSFLEGKRRREMFRSTPLAKVWVHSSRVSMPPGGSDIKAKGGAVAFAWFVWRQDHEGPPTIGWLP